MKKYQYEKTVVRIRTIDKHYLESLYEGEFKTFSEMLDNFMQVIESIVENYQIGVLFDISDKIIFKNNSYKIRDNTIVKDKTSGVSIYSSTASKIKELSRNSFRKYSFHKLVEYFCIIHRLYQKGSLVDYVNQFKSNSLEPVKKSGDEISTITLSLSKKQLNNLYRDGVVNIQLRLF